jgi:glycosyltransferase involved in cell wall biosynthesis
MPLEEKKKHINPADEPLVSIITPLYNAASFISETIQSAQNQSYQHWEHLIVDDASSDTSLSIAERYASSDSRIRIIKNAANQGAAVCRNQATKVAKGDYIAFLDADDLWHPAKLEKQVAFMLANDASVSYTSYTQIDVKGNSLKRRIKALPSLSYRKQLRNNYIGNLTGIYHVAEIGKIVAPNLRKRQDWGVWLEAIKRSDKPALGIQEDLAMYRVHHNSMSSNKGSLVEYNFNFYRKHLGYSWMRSVLMLGQFFWEYFVNRPKLIEQL